MAGICSAHPGIHGGWPEDWSEFKGCRRFVLSLKVEAVAVDELVFPASVWTYVVYDISVDREVGREVQREIRKRQFSQLSLGLISASWAVGYQVEIPI